MLSPPGEGEEGRHTFRASTAIRTASLASTVPISRRCTSIQLGRLARNSAIDPAASAVIALTLTLIGNWIAPSATLGF